jgi:hypothetical protein
LDQDQTETELELKEGSRNSKQKERKEESWAKIVQILLTNHSSIVFHPGSRRKSATMRFLPRYESHLVVFWWLFRERESCFLPFLSLLDFYQLNVTSSSPSSSSSLLYTLTVGEFLLSTL